MEQRGRRRVSASGWRTILARFSRCDTTVGAFCKRERVCLSSFYRWRSILGLNEGEQAPADHAVTVAKRPVSFVDLGALGPAVSRSEVRVDLGGGVTLSVVRG